MMTGPTRSTSASSGARYSQAIKLFHARARIAHLRAVCWESGSGRLACRVRSGAGHIVDSPVGELQYLYELRQGE
jgi:hypothetical protein